MNLRCTKIAILSILFGSVLLGGGCDSLIYDEMLDCTQGLYVKLYSKTPCDVDSLYPADIKSVCLFVFDENDRFVEEHMLKNITISNTFEYLIPINKPGKYSVVAWSGLGDHCMMENLKAGISTKNDLLFELQEFSGFVQDLKGVSMYAGEFPAVEFPEPESIQGTYFEHVGVNMLEITNRVEVIVEGIPNPEDYLVEISIRNAAYSVRGIVMANSPMVNYPSEIAYGTKLLTAVFTLMKLEAIKDHRLTVKTKDGKIIFDSDFLGVLLQQNPNVNLSCVNDFVIKFVVAEEAEGYVGVEVWVNDWLIHTYNTGVGGDGY